MLLLRTFGGLALVDPQRSKAESLAAAPLLGPAKPLAMVTYLALSPDRRAERDKVVEILWGRAEPERARGTLRQTVWALRQKFGDDALRTERNAIALTLPLDVDALQFGEAVPAGNLHHA